MQQSPHQKSTFGVPQHMFWLRYYQIRELIFSYEFLSKDMQILVDKCVCCLIFFTVELQFSDYIGNMKCFVDYLRWKENCH